MSPKINVQLSLKLLLCLLFTQIGFAQFDIPEKPQFQTSVYDYANLLNASEKAQLEEKLVRYSDSTSTQMVVITIESLKNEDPLTLAVNWAHKWGLGQSDKDNGTIILVAKNDRRIAIAPGYGLEDRLTAGQGGEIIRNIITPEFKTGNYYGGLDKGVDALFEVYKGKYKGERKKDSKGIPILPIIIMVIIFIVLISRRKNNGGNSGNRGGGPSLLDMIILSNLGRSSGGGFGGFGGGSSGGGFGGGGFGGGFGGGGFSGGGSSGSW